MLRFYYNFAPNPTKVALLLEECGLPYEPVPVDTHKGEQFAPGYLAINPNGKVPAIVDGDVTVFDSNAILLRRPGRDALLADVRRDGPRALLGPGGSLPPHGAGARSVRPQPLSV